MKTHGSRWFVLGLLCLAAAGCGDDDGPTTPTAATPSFAGTWVGSSQLQQCSNAVLCGPPPYNTVVQVEFVLAQTGTSVSGTFTANGAEPRIVIAGSVASDGSVNLSGRPPGAPGSLDSTRLTVAGSTMSGTLTYSLPPPNPGVGGVTLTIGLQGVTRR